MSIQAKTMFFLLGAAIFGALPASRAGELEAAKAASGIRFAEGPGAAAAGPVSAGTNSGAIDSRLHFRRSPGSLLGSASRPSLGAHVSKKKRYMRSSADNVRKGILGVMGVISILAIVALMGAGCGVLIGLCVGNPVAGAVIGAAVGLWAGVMGLLEGEK